MRFAYSLTGFPATACTRRRSTTGRMRI
jgi:hypothetical protein